MLLVHGPQTHLQKFKVNEFADDGGGHGIHTATYYPVLHSVRDLPGQLRTGVGLKDQRIHDLALIP